MQGSDFTASSRFIGGEAISANGLASKAALIKFQFTIVARQSCAAVYYSP